LKKKKKIKKKKKKTTSIFNEISNSNLKLKKKQSHITIEESNHSETISKLKRPMQLKKWFTLTSDPEKVNPRVWEADHGAVRRLLRVEAVVVAFAAAEIGGDGGEGEEEVVEACAMKFDEILQWGCEELESLLLSFSDRDCIFFPFLREVNSTKFIQTHLRKWRWWLQAVKFLRWRKVYGKLVT